MRYKALFLDMDGTFLDFHASEREAFFRALGEAGIEATQERYLRYSAINDGLWKTFEKGEIGRDDIRRRRFSKLFAEFGIEADGVAVEKEYERFLGEGHALMPHAKQVLKLLALRYPLYAVTNGFAQVQQNRLKLAGIGRYMTDSFVSEEIGWQKPQKEFFDVCFSRLSGKVMPRDVLLVGDSLTSDILGAKNAGIDSCWFNPSGVRNETGIQPDYEIRSLPELPALLDEREGQEG